MPVKGLARTGKGRFRGGPAQGYRLLVDTLKWRASKMKPRSYGDKLTLEAEVNVRQMTDEQLMRGSRTCSDTAPALFRATPSRRLATLSNLLFILIFPVSSPPRTSPAPSSAMSSPGWRRACKHELRTPFPIQRSARRERCQTIQGPILIAQRKLRSRAVLPPLAWTADGAQAG